MNPPRQESPGARDDERGQGLLEYGLVIILVAIVIVAILALVGPQVANLFSRVTSAIPY